MFRLKSHYVTTEKDVVSLSYVNKMYFELENQNLIQVSVQIRTSADNAHSADARRCCGAAAAVERRPCSNRSPSPARQVNSSKPAAVARAAGWDRRTDRWTDGRPTVTKKWKTDRQDQMN